MLAEASPASYVAFDCLADGDDDLRAEPVRRAPRAARASPGRCRRDRCALTPSTTDPALAQHWFEVFEGAGLDGVIAKRADEPYAPGKRTMAKIKHARTADCVVAGFRWHKNGPGTLIGSLLLGLWNDEGHLQHVGVTSSFTMAKRAELVEFLEPYRRGGMDDHPWREWAMAEAAAVEEGSGCPAPPRAGTAARTCRGSRCAPSSCARSPSTTSRATDSATRTTFRRWRPDRSPADCRYDQLEETPPALLADLFGS